MVQVVDNVQKSQKSFQKTALLDEMRAVASTFQSLRQTDTHLRGCYTKQVISPTFKILHIKDLQHKSAVKTHRTLLENEAQQRNFWENLLLLMKVSASLDSDTRATCKCPSAEVKGGRFA